MFPSAERTVYCFSAVCVVTKSNLSLSSVNKHLLNKRQCANQLVQMSVCCAHESNMTRMYELLVLTLSIFSVRGKKIFEPPRYMSVNQAAEQLLAVVQNRRLQGQEPGIICL